MTDRQWPPPVPPFPSPPVPPFPPPGEAPPLPVPPAVAPGRGQPAGAPGDGWRRLHPLSPVVRAGRATIAILGVIAVPVITGGDTSGDRVRLALLGVAALVGAVSWLVTRWRVADGALQIETGVLRRSSLRYPLTQIQAVDTVRPGLARILGLAELRLRMAGAKGSTGRLAYLGNAHADGLRARLLAAAHGINEDTPAPAAQQLYRVDPGRLIGSILISGPALACEVAIAVLAVLAVVDPRAAGGALAASGTALVGAAGAVWRRFNGEYRLSVADAPDGLRVAAGLVETSAETIPRGRVQALRMIQPVTWRAFGWYRVEVDLAGRATSGRQNRAAKQAGRALLPVGSFEQASRLVEWVMPGVPSERVAPPQRVRWKSPLRYRHLSFAVNDRYAVTTSGRLRLVTDWVPLARVQSVRRVEGPLQRRLGLASIHLDTAGRTVFAEARDRDRADADAWMGWLPEACRRARAIDAGIGTGRRRRPTV